MKLGAFSVSLTVKDIEASKVFYEKLGFSQVGGDQTQNWLIMRNGDHTIGLFQGLFDNNLMTFNPGWDKECNALEDFDDIRKIYAHCKEQGIDIAEDAVNGDSGPSHFAIYDPDGNTILIDQHV